MWEAFQLKSYTCVHRTCKINKMIYKAMCFIFSFILESLVFFSPYTYTAVEKHYHREKVENLPLLLNYTYCIAGNFHENASRRNICGFYFRGMHPPVVQTTALSLHVHTLCRDTQ